MEFLIVDILLTPIGWIILFVKYRNLDKLKSVVKSEFDDDYSNVAKNYFIAAFLMIIAVLILALIVITVMKSIF